MQDKENIFKLGGNSSYDESKSKIEFLGQGNSLIVGDGFSVGEDISIIIEGNNNQIIIGKDFKVQGQCSILISGDDNKLTIGNNLKANSFLKIDMRKNTHNSEVNIGNSFSIYSAIIGAWGQDNVVSIGDNLTGNACCVGAISELLSLKLQGQNNKINLGQNIQIVQELAIYMCMNGKNRLLSIGDKSSFMQTEIHDYDNDSSVSIGKDCMFALNANVFNTDSHPIFQNGKLINKAENCTIGDHVWVGQDAVILKNSLVSDGSIVARRALVSKKFTKKNCILAGVPAKIVKENIEWSNNRINNVLENL